jgi:hypothetical protein
MVIRKFVFACALLLLFSMAAMSQGKKISMSLHNARFTEFVAQLEKQCSCHLYYNTADTDSLLLSIEASNFSLEEVLKAVLAPVELNYSIDGAYNVFISKRPPIRTALPNNFFTRSAIPVPAVDSSILTAVNNRSKSRNTAVADNKLYEIGNRSATPPAKASVAGYIRDIKSGEPLVGASVYIDSPYTGVYTDQFGYYSISLPTGYHTLMVSSIGMKETRRLVLLHGDGKLDIELQDYVPALKAVIVQAEKRSNVKGLQMGVERLSIKTIKQVPVVFGETDVLRVVLTLPGVSSVGEASTGFNVRGGAADQNLILFNDATIYNPSHLFGFFSAFNADLVKNVELYKSTIPEKYGGRLSSVLDVTTRTGNQKKLTGTGGIGLLTGRLTLEGPLVKDKTSFIAGVRTTYSDWLLNMIPGTAYENSSAGFSDVNLQLNHSFSSRNSLFVTGYLSNDRFRLRNDTTYKYGNRNLNVKWKSIFNNQLNAVFTVGADQYNYSVSSEGNKVTAYKLAFRINQYYLRGDFNYSPSNKHAVSFGINSIYYKLQPGSFDPVGAESLVTPDRLQDENALESAIYAGDQYSITDRLSINAGIRYSVFNLLGPRRVYDYAAGVPRSANTLTDSTNYSSGKVINTYHGPEYRVALRYVLSDASSLKLSYNTLRQYIHTLSNTVAISPTDTWKLSDPHIKPQRGEQISLGYYRNFRSNTIETSVEVYFKRIKNYLDYKSGAVLLMNKNVEEDVINTRGKAYGAELMIRKTAGKLNGWISYTWARTLLQMDDPIAGELINEGKYYPANFDKPHTVNFIGNYRFSHRYSLSLNTVYSTGRPITLPLAMFDYGGSQRVYYSQRNQYRVPDYFRVDIAVTIEGNHKIKKLAHSSWSMGVYNASFRKNPYSIYFVKEGNVIKGYQLSIFGTAIPFITYNFRF